MNIKVIGAGLAGCEAALQLSKRGYKVDLFEMKTIEKSPAHNLDTFCELVCSNSLKSTKPDTASGLLKAEMNLLGCELLKIAQNNSVPAGGALAVDREKFSLAVSELIHNDPNINVIEEVVKKIPDEPCIIATGPLTHEDLAADIQSKYKSLFFFDAASPIVETDSIDMNIAFEGARYEENSKDYINCPFTKEEYDLFWNELTNATVCDLADFDKKHIFEGCMPVEVMAKRGYDTLRFGPLKPVGLIDKRTDKRPFAVVQLRMENEQGQSYNLVGFQTNLKFPEQKRVFSLIPGLKNAEFLRYGVMHKNTYLNSPLYLNQFFASKDNPLLFFAGQITGVEGYVESIASGMLSAINMARTLEEKSLNPLSNKTILGALCTHVARGNEANFQPMNANFGIVEAMEHRIKNKRERYGALSNRSLEYIKDNINLYI